MNQIQFQKIVNYGKSSFHKNYESKKELISTRKLIAFYLPQFHSFMENDKNWGEGFTEWRNVSKSLPLFEGHIQPRHPANLGYYDLRIKENIVKQAKYAKNYGVSGFAIYYYWFNSKKIMDTVIESIYNDKSIDIEYCVFWANESWTKNWDGLPNEILLQQNHSETDDLNFIKEISKYFHDPRYIKHEGRPVIMIYRPSLFDNPKRTAQLWKRWCIENGFKEPYLMLSQAFQDPYENSHINPDTISFDAAFEFPPHKGTACDLNELNHLSEINWLNGNSEGNKVFNYTSAVKAWTNKNKYNFKHFKTVFPSWDNSPRRQNGNASIFFNSSPDLYYLWLKYCLLTAQDNDFVFINAWNEWAEGAYLEPDSINGFAYLEKTYEAIFDFSRFKI
jgi:O-antigen biosynthesis protein